MKSERVSLPGYDEVWRLDLDDTIAFVSLHAVICGRTFGGIRCRSYPDEKSALRDALDLSLAMSRKVALTGIEGGGAKTVIIAPKRNRAEVVAKLGDFIDGLAGRYFCGADLGFTPEDVEIVAGRTRFVAREDLSSFTAKSVLLSLEAMEKPKTAAVQGLGSIGRPVAKALREQGVHVVASELSPTTDFETVSPEKIYETDCDLLSPCATGGVLNEKTIPRLRCRVICGGANNPLGSDEDAERLRKRGITYVPDFISNSGATIQGASTAIGETEKIESRFNAIPPLVREVLDEAARENRSPHFVAASRADGRIASLR